MKVIYQGLMLFRDCHPDAEKGDTGYIEYEDMPIVQTPISFYLNDVRNWEDYKDKIIPLTTTPDKLMRVTIKNKGCFYLVESYKVFCKIMFDFNDQRNARKSSKESTQAT